MLHAPKHRVPITDTQQRVALERYANFFALFATSLSNSSIVATNIVANVDSRRLTLYVLTTAESSAKRWLLATRALN